MSKVQVLGVYSDVKGEVKPQFVHVGVLDRGL